MHTPIENQKTSKHLWIVWRVWIVGGDSLSVIIQREKIYKGMSNHQLTIDRHPRCRRHANKTQAIIKSQTVSYSD